METQKMFEIYSKLTIFNASEQVNAGWVGFLIFWILELTSRYVLYVIFWVYFDCCKRLLVCSATFMLQLSSNDFTA